MAIKDLSGKAHTINVGKLWKNFYLLFINVLVLPAFEFDDALRLAGN
eukprot:SAG22_NODE_593_length_8808_cov_21.674590_3_plen_47_part_00